MATIGTKRRIVGAVATALTTLGCLSCAAGTASAESSYPVRAAVDVLLPDEGERSTTPGTGWTSDSSDGQTWLLDPCRPTAYPMDSRRTGFRTVSRTGPEAKDARQLAEYPDPRTAAEAVAGFRRALTACSTGGRADQGNRWQWVTEEASGLGDEGFVAAGTRGGPGFSPAGERIAVTRTGSRVFLAYVSGEFATARLDRAARGVEEVARTFVEGR